MSKHRRNLILDPSLALRVMDWHGGQTSMLYSLASTAHAGDYVSVSMIRAGIEELEGCDSDDVEACMELEDLIAEMWEIVENPEEHSTLHLTGDDTDSGFATWLQDEEEESEDLEELEELSNFDEPLDIALTEDDMSEDEENW